MFRRLLLAMPALFILGCGAEDRSGMSDTRADRDGRRNGNDGGYRSDDQRFVGPRGPDGPQGPDGMQGPAGETGRPGYAMAGPRGDYGPAGQTGPMGYSGEAGHSGYVVAGPRGERGRAGDSGPQGEAGSMGRQGSSLDGFAGPSGAAGPEGARGPTGSGGGRGPTLVGPTGPAGYAGPSGGRGVTGPSGAQGVATAGVAGPAGYSGPRGATGSTGPTGAQGSTGTINRWTPYRSFWFDKNTAEIQRGDSAKVSEIASYLNQNPSLQVGIDNSMGPDDTARGNQSLNGRRVDAIRNALVQAGVPSSRIDTGNFDHSQSRRDGRVAVLIVSR